jgi:hypothetical protein
MSRRAVLEEVRGYILRIGDGISQLLNVAIFFGDNPNERLINSGLPEDRQFEFAGATVFVAKS